MKWLSRIFRPEGRGYTKRIYADYAALTPVSLRVQKVMTQAMKSAWGNPSSLYKEGVQAKKQVAEARLSIAKHLRAHPDELIFTGSGTEANNLALRGIVEKEMRERKCSLKDLHVIVSTIEHSSLLEAVNSLANDGLQVCHAPVNDQGVVDEEELKKLIKKNTVFVSIMMVNNEVGTVEPIREIAKLIRWARKQITLKHIPVFHVDASQAILYQDINLESLGADMLTLDAHKMYGPRGVGLLWVKRGINISPLILGGKQERGLRSGTENVPGILGMAEAFKEIDPSQADRLMKISEHFIKRVKKEIPGSHLHAGEVLRSPHVVNFYFEKTTGDYQVIQLDALGISCATKSACLRDADESYVLRAMGKEHEIAANSIRFSFGRETTMGQVDEIVEALKKTIAFERMQSLQ